MLNMQINNNLPASLALLLLCLIAYGNSLTHEFLMDDRGLILNNTRIYDPQFLQISSKADEGSGTFQKSQAYFRPLYHIFIMLNHSLFGKNAVGYHAVNLIFHYLGAYAFYVLVSMLFKNAGLALLSGAFYAVHPINGLLVNYSNTTAYSFMVFAMLAAIVCFLKMNLAEGRCGVYFIFSLSFFAAALLCHEVASFYPLYWGVCLFCLPELKPRRAWLYGLCMALIIVIYAWLRSYIVAFPHMFLSAFSFFDFNVFSYTASLTQLLSWYFYQLVYPAGIVLMWEGKILTQAPQIILWLGMPAIFVILLLKARHTLKQRKAYILSLGWMAVGVLPVALASLSRPNYGFIIEPHWLIFVSLAFFAGLGQLWMGLKNRMRPALWAAGLACLLGVYIITGWRYNYLWANEERYLAYWLGESKEAYLPNFWMGSNYLEKGDLARAKYHYERILQRRYTDWETYVNLGVIEYYAGNSEAALLYYQKALAVNNKCADALNNIGVIFRGQGERDKARYYFNKALEIDSRHVDARRNLNEIKSRKSN